MAKVDHELPLARHVVSVAEFFHIVQDLVTVGLVRPKEVVISDPERKLVIRAFYPVEAVRMAVRRPVGTVETLDQLLVWTVPGGDGIVVCKADHLRDLKLHPLAELKEELLCCKRIGAVAVGNKKEAFRKLILQLLKGHAHRHDAGTCAAVVGDLIPEDRTAGGIHDEPDEGMDAADLNVCLISHKGLAGLIVVMVHKGLYTECGRLTVVGDLLVGYLKAVEIHESLGRFPQGKPEVDVQGKAEPHDVGVVLAETQGRGVLRETLKGHPEEVNVEFPVNVMELVIALAVRGIGIHFFEVVFVVGAVLVDAFPDNKEFPVLHRDESMSAERAAKLKRLVETVVLRGEHRAADLAQELAFGTIVAVEVLGRGVTARALRIGRNTAFAAPANRPELAAVVGALVFTPEVLPVLFLQGDDPWELIRFELLVLWGMCLIISPLLERDVSADKTEKPAFLIIKIIDD